MFRALLLSALVAGPALAPAGAGEEPRGEVVAEIGGGEEDGPAGVEPEPVRPTPAVKEEEPEERGTALSPPGPQGHAGLVHAMAATSGDSMSFSVGFSTRFFLKRGFLYAGDEEDRHVHFTGTLHGSFTPARFLELFLAIDFRTDSTDLEIQDPRTYRRLGNSLVGLKGLLPLSDVYTLALAVVPRFFVKVDDVPFEWAATSVELMLAQTFTLASRTRIPLTIHLNLGWDFRNTAKLVEKRERELSEEAGSLQYIMRFERFVLDVGRADLLHLGVGVELDVPWVSPFVDWSYDIPVQREAFDCIQRRFVAFPDDDSCLSEKGSGAFHMNLALGLRLTPPPAGGLSFLVAADVGLTGVGVHVRELPANPPYVIYIGLSYTGSGKSS